MCDYSLLQFSCILDHVHFPYFVYSYIFPIGYITYYVNMTFQSPRRMVCKFLSQHINNISCNISYGKCGEKFNQSVQGNVLTSSPNTVVIDIHEDIQDSCYLISARYGNLSFHKEGMSLMVKYYKRIQTNTSIHLTFC